MTPAEPTIAVATIAMPMSRRQTHVGDFEPVADHILAELFFTMGQVVGMRKSVDYDAIVWWRDHFRPTFVNSMQRFGNRWKQDRHAVSAVSMLLAERAVQYAGDGPSITVASAKQAAEDAQRYCELHAKRQSRRSSRSRTDGTMPMRAGYWCVPDPPPEEPPPAAY